MKKKNNNTPPSSYRLPKETLEKIEKIKKATGMSGAEVIAKMVAYHVVLNGKVLHYSGNVFER